MGKIQKETEEFAVTYCKKKKLNEFIINFKKVNPNYDVLNISAAGTGGQLGGTIHLYIIWRRFIK